jgi:hypothetical protein
MPHNCYVASLPSSPFFYEEIPQILISGREHRADVLALPVHAGKGAGVLRKGRPRRFRPLAGWQFLLDKWQLAAGKVLQECSFAGLMFVFSLPRIGRRDLVTEIERRKEQQKKKKLLRRCLGTASCDCRRCK